MTIALLNNSHGTRPKVTLDHHVPEGITGLATAAESESILVGSATGQLTLMSRTGEILATDRSFRDLSLLAIADAGNFGAAVVNDDRLVCFDSSLSRIWDVRITGRITALAIAPHGGHLAFSTDGCRTHIVTVDKRELAQIDTLRPLDHLAFLSEEPALIGAAEFGSLCSYQLDGREDWNENVMNNIGDISVSGCGRRILLSAFNHGIQVYNRSGKQRGSFMLDGIPNRVSASDNRTRIAAITLENRVYWLNFDGAVQWVADLSADSPQFIQTGAMGDRLLLVTSSGRLLQLEW